MEENVWYYYERAQDIKKCTTEEKLCTHLALVGLRDHYSIRVMHFFASKSPRSTLRRLPNPVRTKITLVSLDLDQQLSIANSFIIKRLVCLFLLRSSVTINQFFKWVHLRRLEQLFQAKASAVTDHHLGSYGPHLANDKPLFYLFVT